MPAETKRAENGSRTSDSVGTPGDAHDGDTSEMYAEYANDRVVHENAQGLVKSWHGAMATHFERTHGGLRGKRVLEVGYGHGFFADVASERGADYRALEMSAAIARAARGVRVEVGRIPPLPAHLRASVDVVWMSHVLEHARDWIEARAMCACAFEALVPGGHFVVIGPDLNSIGAEFWNGDWSHGYPTSARRCVQLLHDCGFVEVTGEHHRGGRFGLAGRAVAATIATLFPYRTFDRVVRRSADPDTGFGYSYMTVFGWRQIFVVGKRA